MKKSILTMLIIGLAAMCLLVSCNQDVAQSSAEDLVSVSFEESVSRALVSTLEDFKKGEYYWKYAAKKADSSNLLSGETPSYDADGAQWIKVDDSGNPLAGLEYKVYGFSQGLWDFTLYAYKNFGTVQSPDYRLVYQGETTGHLLKSGSNLTHKVNVIVSPVTTGTGTLSVLITGDRRITLEPVAELPPEVLVNAKVQLKIEELAPTAQVIQPLSFFETNYSDNTLEPGTYKVTVYFTNDDGVVVYASGSVVATVYSGLTTEVSGSLNEVVTYIEFDAIPNPDIISATIGTDEIDQSTSEEDPIEFGEETDKVYATMPVAAAKELIGDLEKELGAKTSDPDNLTSSLELSLSVNTTEATETKVTYDIGMEAILTYEKIGATSGDTTTTTSTVKNLPNYVTVVVDVESDVSSVYVTHSGVRMHETDNIATAGTTSGDADSQETVDGESIWVGFYMFDPDNQKLYIKTRSFSPFGVMLTLNEYVAAIGSTKYMTLADALDDAENGQEIVLLKDLKISDVINSNLQNLTINLNGKTLEYEPISNNSYWGPTTTFINVADGKTLTITDKAVVSGTIKIDPKYTCTVNTATVRGTLNLGKINIVLDISTYQQSVDQSVYGNNTYPTNRATVNGITNYGTVNIDGTTMDLCPSGKNGSSLVGLTMQNNAVSSILNAEFDVTAGATGVEGYNGSSNQIEDTLFVVKEAGTGISIKGANATIEDCTIDMSGSASSAYGIAVNKSATASTESAILISGNTAITADYEGYGATCLSVKAGAVIVDGSISIDAGENGTAVEFGASALSGFENSAQLEIRSGEYSGDVSSFSTNGTMVISGGSFSGDVYCSNGGNETDGNLRITGGSFTGGFGAAWYDTNNRKYMKISGGIFDEDPSAYVADGYYAKYHPAAGTDPEYWTVEAVPANAIFALINNDTKEVNFIYDSNFSSITDSGLGVPANHTLKLLKDYTLTAIDYNWGLIAFNGNNITFDLNGHVFTFTWSSCEGMFVANGSPENLVFKNGTITQTDKDEPLHTTVLFFMSYFPTESSFVDATINYYGITYPTSWSSRQMPEPNS